MMKKFIKIQSVLPMAIAIAVASCGNEKTVDADDSASVVTVRVISMTPQSDCLSNSYVGTVEPSKSTALLSQFPGTVETMEATKGKRVSKGAVLATISSEGVRSAYEIAKATLEQARDGYDRACKVYESGTLTEVKMVEIKTRLEQAESAEKSARKALEECNITAPFTGVIGEVYAHRGERVTAAQPVLQIVDVESVEIHFKVPESEYSSVALGAKARVEVPALRKTVDGSVAVKGVCASALSHAYDFTLKNISDPYQLMPGMTCKVRIEPASEDTLFVVPASAVRTDNNGRYVWSVGTDNLVTKRYVTVSGYSGTGVAISEGLSAGDLVIVEGSSKVSTGMKVNTCK